METAIKPDYPVSTDAGEGGTESLARPAALADAAPINPSPALSERARVLPLPGWLSKVYFIFPVVLYIPDALFNYYVYSDGAANRSTNLVLQTGFIILWGFLSVGVVGMAYLLSVLAPWHWGQGHRIQAIFCGFGVVVATGITTWNSLAYRSQSFVQFQTDRWAYALWPQLQANHISVTMILVSIAPPFWGLFWAVVQPTQTGRSLRQLQESHEERLMRLQQEAELKKLRAQTNATIREAQVRGMAQTAAAVREQAGGLLNSRRAQYSRALPSQHPDHVTEFDLIGTRDALVIAASPLQPQAADQTSADHDADGAQGDQPMLASPSQGHPEMSEMKQPDVFEATDGNANAADDEPDHGLSYPLHARATATSTESGKKRAGSARGVKRTSLASYGIPR